MSKLNKIAFWVLWLVIGSAFVVFFLLSKKITIKLPKSNQVEINIGYENYVNDSKYFQASLTTWWMQSCDSMSDTDNKYTCKLNFMMNNLSYLTTGNCQKHLSWSQLSRCLNWVYFSSFECDKISDLSFRASCEDFAYVSVAHTKKNKDICNKIKTQSVKDDCLKSFK